jgi:hypothetical protein
VVITKEIPASLQRRQILRVATLRVVASLPSLVETVVVITRIVLNLFLHGGRGGDLHPMNIFQIEAVGILYTAAHTTSFAVARMTVAMDAVLVALLYQSFVIFKIIVVFSSPSTSMAPEFVAVAVASAAATSRLLLQSGLVVGLWPSDGVGGWL